MGDCVAPSPPKCPANTKIHSTLPTAFAFPRFERYVPSFRLPTFLRRSQRFDLIFSRFHLAIARSTHVIMSYHRVNMSCRIVISSCQFVMSSCHTFITILIRIQLDNIYTMKQLTTYIAIHICKLIHSCKHTSAEQYLLTTNIT